MSEYKPQPLSARLLEWLALASLLACLGARAFLPETPYRTSSLRLAGALGEGVADVASVANDRMELARATFAEVLLAAMAAWLIARVVSPRPLRHKALAAAVFAFACLSPMSIFGASDKFGALDSWMEQTSLLAAGLLAAELFADRRRLATLLIVLTALGATLGAKGVYERAVEAPERAAQFKADPQRQLQQVGIVPGSPQAKAYETRLCDPAALGYFPLSNIFASMMILTTLAALGLAGDKLVAAVKSKREQPPAKTSELNPVMVAAVATALAGLLAAATLVLTLSRGGIIAFALGLAAAVLLYFLGPRLAAHWRKTLIIATACLALAAGAIVAYGLKFDRLPTLSMTFRWYYWKASAGIIAERPLLGVGGGNFAAAYLRHRQPQAEEAVKNPHNVIAQALAEYGVPAGLCYLAALAVVLVGVCRPGGEGQTECPPRAPPAVKIAMPILIAAAVLAGRIAFADAGMNWAMLLIEGLVPCAVLAAALAMAAWQAPAGCEATPMRASRIALACGVAAFALHELINFALWTPATALAFWTCAGASLAQAPRRRSQGDLACQRWPWALAAVTVLGLLAGPGAMLWLQTSNKTAASEGMLRALSADDPIGAIGLAERAAKACPLDPVPAADAARLLVKVCPTEDRFAAVECLKAATSWSLAAVNRDRDNAVYYRLAADTTWRLSEAMNGSENNGSQARFNALALANKAVSRNPMDLRLRLQYARMLMASGAPQEALEQLDAAESIDGKLIPDSIERFSASEWETIRNLREKARQDNITTDSQR